MFRGREMAHTELGRKILDRLVEDLREACVVDAYPEAGRAQHDHGDPPEATDRQAKAGGSEARPTPDDGPRRPSRGGARDRSEPPQETKDEGRRCRR